jgi:hypothetical protein
MAKNDERIKQLMAEVEDRKEKLGAKPKATWLTNGVFKFSASEFFNLNTIQNSDKLVEALSFLINKTRDQDEAAQLLGVSEPSFEWGGYSIQDWLADFKTRLSIVTWEANKAKLDATQAKLAQLVSEEARTEMELDSISKSISNL